MKMTTTFRLYFSICFCLLDAVGFCDSDWRRPFGGRTSAGDGPWGEVFSAANMKRPSPWMLDARTMSTNAPMRRSVRWPVGALLVGTWARARGGRAFFTATDSKRPSPRHMPPEPHTKERHQHCPCAPQRSTLQTVNGINLCSTHITCDWKNRHLTLMRLCMTKSFVRGPPHKISLRETNQINALWKRSWRTFLSITFFHCDQNLQMFRPESLYTRARKADQKEMVRTITMCKSSSH